MFLGLARKMTTQTQPQLQEEDSSSGAQQAVEDEFVVTDYNDEEQQQQEAKQNKTPAKKRLTPAESTQEFTKLLLLEEELKMLHKQHDTLILDRNIVERKFKEKELSLSRTTVELENALAMIDKLKDEMKKKDNKIKALQEQNKTLSEMETVSKLVKKKTESEKDRVRANAKLVAEESLDKIILMENEQKLNKGRVQELENEIRTINLMLEKKDKSIEQLTKCVEDYKYKDERAYELECANSELKIQVDKLNKEVRTLQQVQRLKTSTIEKLNEQFEKLALVQEENKDLNKKLLQKEKDMNLLKTEINISKRANDKKDREIFKIAHERDEVPLKTLEHDKRFLQSELKKRNEAQSTNEKTIQYQKSRIEVLEARFAAITQALRDTKWDKVMKPAVFAPIASALANKQDEKQVPVVQQEFTKPDDEHVSVILYNVLQADLDELRKLLHTNEILIKDKDMVIETLEKKLDIVEKSKQSDGKASKKKHQELMDKLELYKTTVANLELEFKSKEQSLKRETFAAKKKLNESIQKK